jgi:predicted sulfurtransferase
VSHHAQSGADMGDEASECVGCGEETPRQSLTRCPNCYGDYCPSCYDTHTEPWKRRREEGNPE